LKAAWFQPLRAYKSDILVQAFAFKWVNLCRYALAQDGPATDDADGEMGGANQHMVEDEHVAAVY
jgi:hypothetical protein